jgi:hypothetical protein
MDLQEVGWGGHDLAKEKDRWWAVVNAVMKFRIR